MKQKCGADRRKGVLYLGRILAVLFISISMSLTACGSSEPDSRIQVPSSSLDYRGMNYQDVLTELAEAGFTNVGTEAVDDLIIGWLTEDGEVSDISVDGDTSFSSGAKYEPDVEIIVTYHTFPTEEDEGEPLAEESIADLDEEKPTEVEMGQEQETGGGQDTTLNETEQALVEELLNLPDYSGKAYVEVNGNVPYFVDSELTAESFESYSNLDSLGRCGYAYACVGQDIMPTEERGDIGAVKPSGWHTVKYNGVVDGNYLYNRCHLIGFQLSGENANEKNLITGTRYMNVEGMLPFENMIADYVKETNNHVLYRVTPLFTGDNLIADGVLMEAESVEDKGESILFNVFCYNVQPGVAINYLDGSSQLDGTVTVAEDTLPSDTSSSASSEEQAVEHSDEQMVAPAESASSVADTAPTNNGSYAVNANNGKIHINGGCPATGNGSNAMKNPVYFDTYEEAEAYSIQIAPGQDKRKCGNCW